MVKKFTIPVDQPGDFAWNGAEFTGQVGDDGSIFIANLLPDETMRVWRAANRRGSVKFEETGQVEPTLRRFKLYRAEDVSGISGTGIVAEGVLFSNGKIAINWLTEYTSVVLWDSLAAVEAVHGHGGRTVIQWID